MRRQYERSDSNRKYDGNHAGAKAAGFYIMVSMLIQSLYNVVDSIFVAQISENAMTAVTLALPAQNALSAVCFGTALGVSTLLSRHLGAREFNKVNIAAQNGIFLSVLGWLAFVLFGLIGSNRFLQMCTSDTEIVQMGTVYLTICTVLSFGCFIQATVESFLRSTGKTIYIMITQLTGAVINIVLDPIMIFGLLGFPKMGIAGAALATVIGQIIAMLLATYFHLRFNKAIHLKVRGVRPNRQSICDIYSVGLPSVLMQSICSVMVVGLNQILIPFTETAVAVFGVYFRLQNFILMPAYGFASGMVPIVAYNLGAQKKSRVIQAIRYTLVFVLSVMGTGMVLILFLAPQLMMMFNASAEMLKIGVPALRILSLSFVAMAGGIAFSTVFQATGNGVQGLVMSLLRQIILLLPTAWLLSTLGLNAIWYAFLIAEVMSLVVALVMFRKVYRRQLAPLGNE